MACISFSAPSIGLFIDNNQGIWASNDETKGNRTCNYTSGNLVVTGPNGSTNFNATSNQIIRHKFFGSNNNLAVLLLGTGNGPQSASVILINFVASSIQTQLILTSTLSQNQIPWLQYSTGTGSACLIGAPGTINVNIAGIYRSDTGDIICPGTGPFNATNEISGEAVAGATQIKHGGNIISGPCPNPIGQLSVSPSSHSFDTVSIGGCPKPLPTEQFTLTNTGTGCLTINGIQNATPYTVIATSDSFPVELDAGESMTATVQFNPLVVGIFNNVMLPISVSNSSGGSTSLECDGSATQAQPDCSVVPSSLNFGTVEVGTTVMLNVSINNTGDVPISIATAGAPGGAVFQWSGVNANLTCGQNLSVPVSFSPTSETPANVNLSVSISPGNNKTIPISGVGCIPNAKIQVPPAPFPLFGEVRQGYRTVRFITVQNTGDAVLNFTASISGPNASLYGILQGTNSITNVTSSRNFSVNPTHSCGSGPTGSGEVIVPVGFFADGAPPQTATATLTIHNHNDSTAPTNFVFQLVAEIIAGNVVDVICVIDRSGSMDDSVLGGGTKMQAAIQAGRLLVNLIPNDLGNRVAATSYGKTANTFLGMEEITGTNQAAKVNAINASEPELNPFGSTAIAAGMMVGQKEFAVPRAGPVPANLVKSMIVLTDGMDNTAFLNPDDNNYYSVLGGQARDPNNTSIYVDTHPYAPPSDVNIYGIGLGSGEDIDTAQLAAISSAAGGYYETVDPTSANTLYQLMKYYTQIYMDLVDTATIEDPQSTIMPGEDHIYEFDMLRGDVSFMVVLFDLDGKRVPFWLESPLGEIIDPLMIPAGFALRAGATEATRFVDVLLPQKEPKRYEKRWRLHVRHEGRVCFGTPNPYELSKEVGFLPKKCRDSKEPVTYGFAIGAGSNFRLQAYLTAGEVKVGEPINMTGVPTEAGLPVLACTVTVEVRAPNGQLWTNLVLTDSTPNDGEYSGKFTHTAQAGSYTFIFRANGYSHDGEPVKREAVRSKYVHGSVRQPPNTGKPGGSVEDTDCCDRIVEILKKNHELLKEVLSKK